MQLLQSQVQQEDMALGRTTLDFLGFEIAEEEMRPVKKLIQAFPVPHKRNQVQSFLGKTNFFQSCIRRYAEIADPLYGLLRGKGKGKTTEFAFTPETHSAFTKLKEVIKNGAVIAPFNRDKDLFIFGRFRESSWCLFDAEE
jgi:hypothetical protein